MAFVTVHAAVRYVERVLGFGGHVTKLQRDGLTDGEILGHIEAKAGLRPGTILAHIEGQTELSLAARAKVSRMARGDWVYIFKSGKLVTIVSAEGYSRPKGRAGLNGDD